MPMTGVNRAKWTVQQYVTQRANPDQAKFADGGDVFRKEIAMAGIEMFVEIRAE